MVGEKQIHRQRWIAYNIGMHLHSNPSLNRGGEYSLRGSASLTLLFVAIAAAQTPANWTRQVPQISPPARYGHAMAYDSAHGQVVLFGGDDGFVSHDTWVWDGSNWMEKKPPTNPPSRFYNAMAYDAVHGQVVLFGGFDGNKNLGDTWVWDGSIWTRANPSNSPPARLSHAMAYDAVHGQIVLFGGRGSLLLDDTWVWDGSNWTQKNPSNRPSARTGSAMAFDSAHGQIILYGGGDGFPFTSNETWAWDGSNWTKRSPQVSPSARLSHSMEYDSGHGQVVLFGGSGGVRALPNDTWTWDGTNWMQKTPQTNAPGRTHSAMAYDSKHGQIVLFGGSDTNGVNIQDTFTWDGGGSINTPKISALVSASGFGGFTTVAPGSWVEIFGSNLATTTRGWGGADFSGNNAPTTLDGVQVTIGGQKAFVDYVAINPGQINAQLPSNIGIGPLQLTVTNANGTSPPFNITVNTLQPGLLAPPAFKIGGNQYVVAQLPDGNYVLPAGAIAGINSRPAKPQETILIFGIGFGAVVPGIPAGQIVTQANQIAAPFQILFGTTPAQSPYFGLAPGFVGLYQFNVVVPAVPDNDLVPLTFNLGGAPGAQILYTAVHQ